MTEKSFQTKSIREGHEPTNEQEHSAAIFLTSSYKFNSAEEPTSTTILTHTQRITQTRSLSNHPTSLDFSTVIKSTQAISEELSLKSLISKVMQAILENAGAQNSALILNSPQGPIVEARLKAQNTRESEYDINVQSIPLDRATDLPTSLIAYVLHTKTEQIIQNASKNTNPNNDASTNSCANEAFITDPYLQAQQPKSVLCIPVTYRDKLLGALSVSYTHLTLPTKA